MITETYGSPIMADQEHSRDARRQPEKAPRDTTGKIGERHGSEGNLRHERQSGAKPGGTVGRDAPDERKEHHTEIAVEAGRTGRAHSDDER